MVSRKAFFVYNTVALLTCSPNSAEEQCKKATYPAPKTILAPEVVLSHGPGTMGLESAVLNVADWSHKPFSYSTCSIYSVCKQILVGEKKKKKRMQGINYI